MVTAPNGTHHNNLITRLRDTARRIAPLSRKDKDLYTQIIHLTTRDTTTAHPTLTSDTPPDEFTEILRRPKGGQYPLSVVIDGEAVGLVLNSRGEANPSREAYLWRWLLNRVRQVER